MTSEKMKAWAPIVSRVGLAIVILWFGSSQILQTNIWTSLIPTWITGMSGLTASTLVHFNGAFEIVFGLCLFFGYFTRVTALLLALHLLDITLTVGYTSIGVRDFGLSMAMISVFFYGVDTWCLDNRFLAKEA